MRPLLPVLLLALTACSPQPTKQAAAPAPLMVSAPPAPAPVPKGPLVCSDAAGHRAEACGDNPNEVTECVAADRFGRCPGDPKCYADDGAQVSCKRPFTQEPAGG